MQSTGSLQHLLKWPYFMGLYNNIWIKLFFTLTLYYYEFRLWTWLVHSLFRINIVFVPSLLASLFAAVPIVMPYWAAIPAVLELIIIQGEYTWGAVMMGAQMAPMSIVDTQIYSGKLNHRTLIPFSKSNKLLSI